MPRPALSGYRLLVVLLAGLVLLPGCATSEPEAPDQTTTQSNGWLYQTRWVPQAQPSATDPMTGTPDPEPSDDSATPGTWRIDRHQVSADGAVGAAQEVLALSGPESEVLAIVDAAGDRLVTATLADFWSTQLQLRDAASGSLISAVDAPQWCGGEGLTYSRCVLVGEVAGAEGPQLAWTSELGVDPEGSISLASLSSGQSDLIWGPQEGLVYLMSSGTAGEVIVSQAEGAPSEAGLGAGVLRRLATATGQVTDLAPYPAQWQAVCPIGADSVLGWSLEGPAQLVMVGPAQIAKITLDEAENPIGCSTDGAYLYVERLAEPSGEESDAGQLAVDSIRLADGSRRHEIDLEPGFWQRMVTR